MDPGEEERLAAIDVADSGGDSLVQQRVADGVRRRARRSKPRIESEAASSGSGPSRATTASRSAAVPRAQVGGPIRSTVTPGAARRIRTDGRGRGAAPL